MHNHCSDNVEPNPKDNSEFAVHCYLLRGSTDIIFSKCYFVESNITNGRKHVSICSIHSNLTFNYLANVLSSAQFQWETVDQSKLHNSENSNAFFFFLVLHWRVKGKGDLYSRWKHVHACLSVYVWQEWSSLTFCNYFSQQIPINPNTQTCKHDDVWKLHKEQYRTLPVSFRVISTHLIGCWLFFVGVGICWPRTIANFNITLFRPRAGVQPEQYFLGVFSRTVSNSHPYGIVANIAEKTPYGTYFNKCSPVRASQTNHFLNTKKQSSAITKKKKKALEISELWSFDWSTVSHWNWALDSTFES